MKCTFSVLHLFCGIGGSALGTAAATAKLDVHTAKFVNAGGIDIDPQACEDFERLTGAPSMCIDLHNLSVAQLKRFCPKCPDVVMASPPCKGFSGLLGAKAARKKKYQQMNRLLTRAMFLVCSTWETVPKIIFFENVPRITSRGKKVIAEAKKIAEAHGYVFAMGNHNCGEIGGLGQNRHRWFMVCRQPDALPASVYNPKKQRVRACGEVLDPLPVPGDTFVGGAMHSLPQLSWQNWVRLSLIPAGGDWRDLPGVLVNGQKKREKFRRQKVGKWEDPHPIVTGPGGSAAENVADPRPVEAWGGNTKIAAWDRESPTVTANGRINGSGASAVADPILKRRHGSLGVEPWDGASGTVTGADPTSQGGRIVADPILERRADALGVSGWSDPARTVTGEAYPSNGRFAVADPRFGNVDRVTDWTKPVGTVTHSPAPSSGGAAVADPRFGNVERVTPWNDPINTVGGARSPSGGAASVADPRFGALVSGHVSAPRFMSPFALSNNPGRHWNKFTVADWGDPAQTVISAVQPESGGPAVADPRFTEGKKKNWQQVGGVTPWTEPSPVVTSASNFHAGAFQVADPRLALVEAALNCQPRSGAYKVLSWQEAAATITGSLSVDNGAAAIADPRLSKLNPKRHPPFIPVIISSDGTWHRPLTTLELAALQGFPTTFRGKPLVLAGTSHTRWREAIGNAVPPPAAQAVGEQLLKAMLSAAADTLNFENTGKWVENIEDGVFEVTEPASVLHAVH